MHSILHSFLLAILLLCSPVAFSTEDVEVPVDEKEKRENTIYVTGQRITGSTSSLTLFVRNGGSINDFVALGLQGDGLTLALACARNPDSFACEHINCEVNPNDPECSSVQEKNYCNGKKI